MGPACVSFKCIQLFIHHTTGDMAHALLSDQFKDRCDPECLNYLEDQLESLCQSKCEETDISQIIHRLEALEMAQDQSSVGAAGQGQEGAMGGLGH